MPLLFFPFSSLNSAFHSCSEYRQLHSKLANNFALNSSPYHHSPFLPFSAICTDPIGRGGGENDFVFLSWLLGQVMYRCSSTGWGAACLPVVLNVTEDKKQCSEEGWTGSSSEKNLGFLGFSLLPGFKFISLLWPWFLCVSSCCSFCCVFGDLRSESAFAHEPCVLCLPQTTVANCISVNHDYIFCGCADGTVRIFNPLNLHFVTTLPKPHFLGTDIASVTEARYCGEGGRGARKACMG